MIHINSMFLRDITSQPSGCCCKRNHQSFRWSYSWILTELAVKNDINNTPSAAHYCAMLPCFFYLLCFFFIDSKILLQLTGKVNKFLRITLQSIVLYLLMKAQFITNLVWHEKKNWFILIIHLLSWSFSVTLIIICILFCVRLGIAGGVYLG
jgi:hypothetical protein